MQMVVAVQPDGSIVLVVEGVDYHGLSVRSELRYADRAVYAAQKASDVSAFVASLQEP